MNHKCKEDPKTTKEIKIYKAARDNSPCGYCVHFMELAFDAEPEPRAVCLFGKRIKEFPSECGYFEIIKNINDRRIKV